jgi:LEA14-like dessication related protein
LEVYNPDKVATSIVETAYQIYHNGSRSFLGKGTTQAIKIDPNVSVTIKSSFLLDNMGFMECMVRSLYEAFEENP